MGRPATAYGIMNHNTLSTSTLSSAAIEGGAFGPVRTAFALASVQVAVG